MNANNVSKKAAANASVAEKISEEPILIFVAIYNFTQVVLCAYMTYRIFKTAYDLNDKLICNRFDPLDDRMAKVHWM